MTEYRSLEDDSSQFFSIRKKTAIAIVLLSILSLCLASYILIQKGLWIGFVEPPTPAPPLSSELISRFTELARDISLKMVWKSLFFELLTLSDLRRYLFRTLLQKGLMD